MTGADKGIGRGGAEQLGALDMTVPIGARDAESGEEVAAALRACGCDAHAVTVDVTDPAAVRDATKQVEERFGHLDLVSDPASARSAPDRRPSGCYS
ncbi:SDR family NAD(P)-dependent oxidoreductase [Geodermatophilus sp. URMC 62]|uniref:SDR family NAD(P)-dependent oxidoreductase n=1 Tax=Geodermatophilus sp. URMC 62 TaxID=3423414 RepID=UPI00406C36B8